MPQNSLEEGQTRHRRTAYENNKQCPVQKCNGQEGSIIREFKIGSRTNATSRNAPQCKEYIWYECRRRSQQAERRAERNPHVPFWGYNTVNAYTPQWKGNSIKAWQKEEECYWQIVVRRHGMVATTANKEQLNKSTNTQQQLSVTPKRPLV